MGEGPTQQPARVAQRDIPRLYNRLARVYDIWAALTESTSRRRSLERASPVDGENMLEVAVGTGQTLAALARCNPTGTIHGTDISLGMVARAQRCLGGIPGQRRPLIALADAHAQPFADRSFDLVVVSYFFDLLPEPDFSAVIAEVRRVVRDTGRIVVTSMTIADRRRDGLYQWVYRLRPSLLGGCRGVRLAPYLAAHGFRVVERDYVTQLGFPSEIVLARPSELPHPPE